MVVDVCVYLHFRRITDSVQDVSLSPAKNPPKMFRQYAGSGAASSVSARPHMSSEGIQPGTVTMFSLPTTYSYVDEVPILDARGKHFNTSTNLVRLDQILPAFNGEVPDGSCVWVGYTANRYSAQKGIALSFNLLWVVVIGTPD